jgi:hypothetical protein
MVRKKKIPTQLKKIKKASDRDVSEPLFILQPEAIMIQIEKRVFHVKREEVANSDLFRFHTSEDPNEEEPHWFWGLFNNGKVTDIYEHMDYTKDIDVSKWVRHGKFLNWCKGVRNGR